MTLKSNSPVADFFQNLHPFSELTEPQLDTAVASTSIHYFAQADAEVVIDYQQPNLYVIRSGAFEIRNDQGQLLDRLGEGQFFGYPSLLTGEPVSNRIQILEDGLVYVLSEQAFTLLSGDNRVFGRFFNRQHAQRLRNGARYQARDVVSTTSLKTVMSTPVQSISSTSSVQQAAMLMQQQRVSALAVIDNNQLVGIMTDRDLRNQVIAKGLSSDVSVATVMTPDPHTLNQEAMVFEASLLMGEQRFHHLPVMGNGQVVGMLTSTDLLRLNNTDLLHLVGQIGRCGDSTELAQLSLQFPTLLQQMISADARAEEIGRVLTQLTDTLTRRLLELGQDKFGAAPINWCWLSFGSQARMDQAGKSDQDNGLLLASEPDESQRRYFIELATFVCDGLNDCGYVHCPGDIMAMNPKWCLSLGQWQQQFRHWISEPEPTATMHASIFFDMRPICGNTDLAEQLQQYVLNCCEDQQLFFAQMAANALKHSPPLGFFRQLVLERDGEQGKVLDLKHRGLVPINDIGRIYALACGSAEVNTLKRLQAAMKAGLITRKDALNLADAHEFIAHLRLKNQGVQWQTGITVNNLTAPKNLSELVRHQLKQAFLVVDRGQDGIRLKYQRNL